MTCTFRSLLRRMALGMGHSGLDLPGIFRGDFVLRQNCWSEGRIHFQGIENPVSLWLKQDRSLFLFT